MIPRRATPNRHAPALAQRRRIPPAWRVVLLAVALTALLLAGCGGTGGGSGETRIKGQWDMSVGMGRGR